MKNDIVSDYKTAMDCADRELQAALRRRKLGKFHSFKSRLVSALGQTQRAETLCDQMTENQLKEIKNV